MGPHIVDDIKANTTTNPPDHISESFRYPPGTSVPSIRRSGGGGVVRNAERLMLDLDDYRDMFSQRAMHMLAPQSAMPIPPGHPLDARNTTLGLLRAENAKLQRENADLRERIKQAESRSRGADLPRSG